MIAALFNRQTNAVQQSLHSIGLGQIADRPALDRLLPGPFVWKGSDKDDWDDAMLIRQKPLQLEPTQARHSDIED
jgi:hypothetical protein